MSIQEKAANIRKWGAKEGTEEDKETLSRIISAQLMKTENDGNHTNAVCQDCYLFNVIGFDEELAEAISKSFYESYKTWKTDHPNDGKRKQVINAIHTIN